MGSLCSWHTLFVCLSVFVCVPGSCQCVIVPPERGLVGLLPCLPTNYFVPTGLPVNVFTFFMNSTLLAGQEMKDEEVAVQRWALQIGKKNWFQCIPCLLLDTWNLPYLPETPKDYFVQGGNSPSINDHCFYSLWNPRVYIYMWDHVLHHTPQVDCFDHILLYVDISLPLMTPHHKMINHPQAVR